MLVHPTHTHTRHLSRLFSCAPNTLSPSIFLSLLENFLSQHLLTSNRRVWILLRAGASREREEGKTKNTLACKNCSKLPLFCLSRSFTLSFSGLHSLNWNRSLAACWAIFLLFSCFTCPFSVFYIFFTPSFFFIPKSWSFSPCRSLLTVPATVFPPSLFQSSCVSLWRVRWNEGRNGIRNFSTKSG